MEEVTPYQVAVPDSSIQKLKDRLSDTIFPDELESASWDYGSPLADVKRLAAYWRDGYDWRAEEAKINKMPQFRTPIQADGFEPLDIHFVYHKSPVANAIPLLFCHGWPGSFLEVSKLLPLLAAGDGLSKPAFHVIAPSIPSYGFSSGTTKRGFGLAQYAETLHKLMLKLGYEQYATQGGDWGMMITRTMGHMYPAAVRASHLNMIRAVAPTWSTAPWQTLKYKFTSFSQRDLDGFARRDWFLKEGSGYRTEQSTKPQTLGYALADSPVGLLAWIYEKLHDWTDAYAWTDDEILTWVSIYWFSTAGPAANLRIYYESVHSHPGVKFEHRDRTQYHIPGPKIGLAHFPKELTVVPHTWAATYGNVVLQSENLHGGHFAATEHPEVIARDLRNMLQKGGPAYGVVKGHTGYEKVTSRL